MIDANEPTPGGVVKQETPARITTSMIIADLDNGVDRNGIRDKYSLQAWEVKQMFEHPALKGKKAKKIRKLSFTFVDDTTFADVDVDDTNQTSIPVPAVETEVNEAAAMDSIANTINTIESTDDNQLTQF
tara:strand:- start:2236 stop:2625 length:390 start_codon:yes stop_codon:yes gene_type:complete